MNPANPMNPEQQKRMAQWLAERNPEVFRFVDRYSSWYLGTRNGRYKALMTASWCDQVRVFKLCLDIATHQNWYLDLDSRVTSVRAICGCGDSDKQSNIEWDSSKHKASRFYPVENLGFAAAEALLRKQGVYDWEIQAVQELEVLA